MWKDLFDKGKCMVGLHQGDWSFPNEKDCTLIRICTRCAKESRKVEHNLGEWTYMSDGDCDQQQTCLRCELATHREVHQWQEPIRKSEDHCEQVAVCSRCNAEQEAPASHLWSEWKYVSPEACGQTQTCERCGSQSAKRTEHLWGEWHHSEQHGGAVHVCRRCGELALSTQSQMLAIVSSFRNSQASAPRELAAPASNPDAVSAATADGGHAPSANPKGERDPRLVAHWRFTDATPFGTTDYHRVLQANGGFVDSSHYCGQIGESRTGPEPGKWRTGNQTLYLSYSDGRSLTFEYHLENDTLFFPGAKFQRLWERVG